MTKKDYIEFAKMLRQNIGDNSILADKTRLSEDVLIAQQIADLFQKDNPKFNRKKFMQACGIEVK